MTYLDDPDHDWDTLEELGEDNDLEAMMDDLGERHLHEEAIRLILRGYAGLRQRHPEASDEQCLLTSMVWYFG